MGDRVEDVGESKKSFLSGATRALDKIDEDRVDELRRLVVRAVADAGERHHALDALEAVEGEHALARRPRVVLAPHDAHRRRQPRVLQLLLGQRARRSQCLASGGIGP